MRFKDKVAVVTGGANGIGRSVVEQFANEGARVAIWDLADEAGKKLAEEINGRNEIAQYRHVNVTQSEDVDTAVEELVGEWGKIDILINNAGILRDSQLVKVKDGEIQKRMSDEMFDMVIDVNLRGVFICTRAVAPHMIKKKCGVILNATSVVGLYGNFGQTNYVATKSGVIGMTKVWARELGRYGIRVNAIAPGFIATEMVMAMPEKILDGMRQHTPLGRLGEPQDIANAYAFLASDQASFISGTVLSVDGGIVVGT
ncbi:MAG TPA: glucose 1-dehydrogenase [Chloroflexi bacterium]|nr:MAG: 3-oxoacyl-ACP reductase [Chloroflexota bacterium]HDN05097.1 glucose 1-dehydrogenase [Chloroflexota bacterium]